MSDNTSDQIDEDPGFDDDLDDDFEDFEGSGTSLADAWRNNPLVKIGIVAGGLAVLLGGIVLFGGEEDTVAASRMPSGSKVSEVPGSEGVSDSYRRAIEEVDTVAVEDAIRSGGSAIPTPIAPPPGRVILPEDEGAEEDPLDRWRRIQEERVRRVGDTATLEEQEEDPHVDVVQSLANAMATQMQSILETKEIRGSSQVSIVSQPEYIPPWDRAEEISDADDRRAGENGTTEEVVNIILPAGTISYAQLITEADSDMPGPVLARLAGGPLSGSRLLGRFTIAEGGEHLILEFNTIVIDGISQSIDAVAMNPDTATVGMVTDVDRRYFKRVVMPAAAAFIRGFSSAVASAGTRTVTVTGETVVQDDSELDSRQEIMKGVEAAADSVSTLMEEEARQTRVRVRVRAGTPMGVLFLEPVLENN